MRTVRRVFLILAIGVPAVLALLLAVLWIRSGRYADHLYVGYRHRQVSVLTRPHGLEISTWPDPVKEY